MDSEPFNMKMVNFQAEILYSELQCDEHILDLKCQDALTLRSPRP